MSEDAEKLRLMVAEEQLKRFTAETEVTELRSKLNRECSNHDCALDALKMAEMERDQLRADLAESRQKLAEAQADCAAKADALREITELLPSDEPFAWDRKMREIATAALASNAGDALVKELGSLRRRVKALPADWLEDSSLETWFPLTAKELERLRAENMGRDAVDKELLCPSEFQTATGHFDPAGYDPNDCAGCGCPRKYHETAKERALRAQRDQAVSLVRECEQVLKTAKHAMNDYAEMWSAEELGQDIKVDEYGKKVQAWDEKRKAALAKLAALNPPPSEGDAV